MPPLPAAPNDESGPPTDGPDRGNHPAWCDPDECDGPVIGGGLTGHRDVRHVSTPYVWHADDDDALLYLSYCQTHSSGTVEHRGWLLTVRHLGGEEEASVLLSDTNLDTFQIAREHLYVQIVTADGDPAPMSE